MRFRKREIALILIIMAPVAAWRWGVRQLKKLNPHAS